MPDTPGRTNRIEVDLKLLQDANLAKLQEFGKQFDKSVQSLGGMLGSYADQIAAAMGMAGPGQQGAGQPGMNASLAGNVRITPPPTPGARQGGQPPTPAQFMNSQMQWVPPGGPSLATPPSGSDGPGKGLGGIEEQYVRAQKYIGSGVPVGLRQTLGYIAEGQMFGQHPLFNEDGSVMRDDEGHVKYSGVGPLSQKMAQNITSGLFSGQAVGSNIKLFGSHLSNIRAGIMGNVQTGMNLGQARFDNGTGGLLERLAGGLGGPAWRSAMGMQWETLKDSMFGLNPNFSPEQAQAIRQSIQGYGYTGSNFNFLTKQLQGLQVNSNIGPDVAMQMLDPFMRFGGTENFEQLKEVLTGLPGAAKAARMNLKDFSEAVMSTATAVAASTGMTVGSAANAVTAYSAVTGLNPSTAQTLMSDPKNYLLASGMTGQSIWQLTAGHNKMSALMSFGMNQFQNAVGGLSPGQLMTMKNSKNPQQRNQFDQIMSRAQLLYLENPQIFGGQSPREILNMASRTGGSYQGILNRVNAQETIGDLDPSKTTNWHNLISGFGGTAAAQAKEMHDVQHAMASVKPSGNAAQDKVARNKAAQAALLKDFDKANGKAAQKAAKEMTIGLSGETRRYFTLLNKAFGSGNKSSSNQHVSASDYARKVMELASGDISGGYGAEAATWVAQKLTVPGADEANKLAKDYTHFVTHDLNPFN